MNERARRIDHCRVCDSEDWLEVLSFGSVPLAGNFHDPDHSGGPEERFPLDVIVCRTCRLMCLRHAVDPELLFGHYLYVSSDSDLISRHMERIVSLCADRFGLAPGELVVELGSNVGAQLRRFRDFGSRVRGVDPARNLVEVANADGIPTQAAPFDQRSATVVREEEGRARVVLGRQCFAHIDDVHAVLEGVNAVISPEGVLVIEVPYLLNLLRENQFDTIFHEHQSYFSVGTLRTLFARHGLRLVDVEEAPVHGGSVIVFAVPEAGATAPRPSVATFLARESVYGLDSDEAYIAFAERVARVRDAVGDLVRELASQGVSIAGYGAPAKGSALLHACGLGPGEVSFCSDTTSLKHGKLLPGTEIPVRSPEHAEEHPPDYYLLLAWNYAEEILRKESTFLERGGRFVIPVPTPRVVSADSVVPLPGQVG
ncbi:class I SAM-dependent methyltransferase [Nocardiopsis sp. RV163]|uniref:class I SAM-dependent methyltransferase n=1 Tax=Nocardiopsis sp. RV163 TaxID=1661388 RepID=UPI00064C01DE|nr:class I SAM-dependent methyltransferase [Nocardiopsis sp. RV163]